MLIKHNSDRTVPFLLNLHPWTKIGMYEIGVRNIGV